MSHEELLFLRLTDINAPFLLSDTTPDGCFDDSSFETLLLRGILVGQCSSRSLIECLRIAREVSINVNGVLTSAVTNQLLCCRQRLDGCVVKRVRWSIDSNVTKTHTFRTLSNHSPIMFNPEKDESKRSKRLENVSQRCVTTMPMQSKWQRHRRVHPAQGWATTMRDETEKTYQ